MSDDQPTSFERIAIEDIKSPVVRWGAGYWNALRGSRPFPCRAEVHPREIARILPHTHMIQVLDGGEDFLFRIAGEAEVKAVKVPFVGKRLSEIIDQSIEYGLVMKGLFGFVARFGEPAVVRGHMGRGFANVNFAYAESAFLPLGQGETVDHILGFSAYAEAHF